MSTPELKERIIDLLITIYGDSGTFDIAAHNLDKLIEFESDLTAQQKNEIIRLACLNSQIFSGSRPKRKVYNFIRRNQSEIDEEYIRTFSSKSDLTFDI